MAEEEVRDFFGENSPLARIKLSGGGEYEIRPQQAQMAQAISQALDKRENLCVEAPTGVGKTFAYLVPAIFYAEQTGKAVIISTHTINVQEQLLHKDMPLLLHLLDKDLPYCVAKGRSNYLCLRKVAILGDQDQQLLPWPGQKQELRKLLTWADETTDGDRANLPGGISYNLWESVCAERGNCQGNECSFFGSCFLQKARRAVMQSRLVITNHAYFFCALALEQELQKEKIREKDRNAALPEYSAVIFDEGHTLENTAAENLGLKADTFVIRHLLNRLFHEGRNTGLLAGDGCAAARAAAQQARSILEMFAGRLVEWIRQQVPDLAPLRYTSPGHIENYLDSPLQRLDSELASRLEIVGTSSDQGVELAAVRDGLREQNEALTTFFAMGFSDYVYWFEVTGKERQEISFNCVPIDVGPLLQKQVFATPKGIPVIITSATLAINGNVQYFLRRIGATNSRSLVLDSPFDFATQAKMYLPQSMPDPKDQAYQSELESHIRHFLLKTKGHAFVLFTSYSTLRRTADDLEQFLSENQMETYIQGDGLTPRQMLEKFRSGKNAVIFGTDSFWVGVDVPGDALCNVIITKLPFAVPDHPLIAARGEAINKRGGNSFRDYSLPEAVLKFRQGVGRLIRTRSDHGIIVILDGRVLGRSYGRSFLNSLPQCPIEYF